jgi:hypothetical protein
LYDYHDRLISDNLYGKVLMHLADPPGGFHVNFTAMPPEAETFLAASQNFLPED